MAPQGCTSAPASLLPTAAPELLMPLAFVFSNIESPVVFALKPKFDEMQ